MINEEHNEVIKKTVKIRELEQKIYELDNKKIKKGETICHNESNIKVRNY